MKKLIVFILSIGFLFANSLQEIREQGVVRIGVFGDQPPFSTFKDGNFEGFEIEMANKITKNIFGDKKGRVEFVPVKVNDRTTFLQENKVDIIIATFTITEERKQLVDFTSPYFSVNIGVLTPKSTHVSSLNDLRDKKILIEKGATAENFFKEKKFNIIECKTAGDCYRRLKAEEGDAMANDNLIVLAFSVLDPDFEVNIQNLGKPNFLGIAVAKNNEKLKNLIDEQMIKLSKEGFFKEAFDNYLNVFYKGTAEKKYFLLDDIYSFFG